MGRRKKQPAPTTEQLRARLYARLLRAEFPKDLSKFSWQDLEASDSFKLCPRPKGLGNQEYRLLILALAQAKAFQKEIKRLEKELAVLRPYWSPKRLEAYLTLCPVESKRLYREAGEEEARHALRLQEVRAYERKKRRAAAESPKAQTFHRDEKASFTSFFETDWGLPKTLMDFHQITGLSRATLRNILKRNKIQPTIKPTSRRQPQAYGLDATAVVLKAWLVDHVPDLKQRRALIVRTLLHTKHDHPQSLDLVIKMLGPGIDSLGREILESFGSYVEDCDRILYPPRQIPPVTNPDNWNIFDPQS